MSRVNREKSIFNKYSCCIFIPLYSSLYVFLQRITAVYSRLVTFVWKPASRLSLQEFFNPPLRAMQLLS